MKYQFYAIIFDVAGNITPVGSSGIPAKSFVTNIQKVTGISINPSGSVTKNIGENFTISATISPNDANNKTINWNSTNTSVATVDSNGKVTCLSAGTTTITATASDGSGVSASLTLTVRNPINSLTLDKDQTTIMKDGFVATVTATTDPANYADSNISWTIADTSIATLTVSGKTATIKSTSKLGTTTLTVTAGNITKTVTITVTNFVTTTYSYTGSVQQVDLPAGTYKLEVWGAQGGNAGSYLGTGTLKNPGKGGYANGTYTITSPTIIYICIGGCGKQGIGGYNGGGSTWNHSSKDSGGGGGGASHIGLKPGVLSNFSGDYLSNLLIVAGGGGGAGGVYDETCIGGSGGDSCVAGTTGTSSDGSAYGGSAGSLSSGGTGGSTTGGHTGSSYGDTGKFGIGGNSGGAVTTHNYAPGGGGGSGFFGGGGGGYLLGSDTIGGGGGGGSNYVNTSKLSSTLTKAGNTSFPHIAGTGNETGHSGNGAAKITPVN